MGLRPTTIRTIIKSGAEIRASATAAAYSSLQNSSKIRQLIVEEMENDPLMGKKNIPLKTLVIQRKAISSFNELKSNSIQNHDVADFSFTASRGWLDKFKKELNYTI